MAMNAVAEVSREPDAHDFEAIFRELSPMVYRTARALTGRPEEAGDIVQAIFLKLIERELPVVFRKDPRAYIVRPSTCRSTCSGRAAASHSHTRSTRWNRRQPSSRCSKRFTIAASV